MLPILCRSLPLLGLSLLLLCLFRPISLCLLNPYLLHLLHPLYLVLLYLLYLRPLSLLCLLHLFYLLHLLCLPRPPHLLRFFRLFHLHLLCLSSSMYFLFVDYVLVVPTYINFKTTQVNQMKPKKEESIFIRRDDSSPFARVYRTFVSCPFLF